MHSDRPWRLMFILMLFAIALLALAARLVNLHVFNHGFLSEQGDLRTVRTVTLPAHRGMILDRHGDPLAVSTPVDSIWINPKEYFAQPQDIQPLAEALSLDLTELAQRLHENRMREFLYLRRHLNPETAQTLLDLNIPGVYAEREYRRFYPLGEAAAHIVGLTNIDGRGQEGLELAFEPVLAGQPGQKTVLKDRLGRVIEDLELVRSSQDGQDLYLSIDRRIQYLAYRELKSAVTRHQAQGGSLVMLDVNTGEVLAIVNQPSFNPNNRAGMRAESLRNRALTDVLEPGSTMKPLTMAAILETQQVDFSTRVNTSPGLMQVHGNTVRDPLDYGELTLAGILRRSSNVGIAKLLLPLPADEVGDTWYQMGLGQVTQSHFPGEQAGHLDIPSHLDPFSYATLAFGYGLSTTTMQLAQAYAIIAAQGQLTPVSLLKTEQVATSRTVLSPAVADAVREMLIMQHEGTGTGLLAQVAGYQVAGKTGTTRKVGPSGYVDDKHYAMYAGFAPASAPEIAMVVVVDEPSQGEYYGGLVAAPVFANVMGGALRLLAVSPDNTG